MDHVASSIASVKDFRLGGGDSFSDRLSCRYTAVILVLFALMVTTKHYMGDPISCWCPSHLTDAQVSWEDNIVKWVDDEHCSCTSPSPCTCTLGTSPSPCTCTLCTSPSPCTLYTMYITLAISLVGTDFYRITMNPQAHF